MLCQLYVCDKCGATAEPAADVDGGTGLPGNWMRASVHRGRLDEPRVEVDVEATVCSYDCLESLVTAARNDSASDRSATTKALNAEA